MEPGKNPEESSQKDGEPSLTKEDQTGSEEIPAETEPDAVEEAKIESPEYKIDSQEYKSSEKNTSQNIQQSIQTQQKRMGVSEWLKAMNWQSNPFVFNINPSLFVGYRSQTDKLLMALEEKHKLVMVLGPTGSGKTTLLRWLQTRTKSEVLYIGKPPHRAEEFVTIFNEKYPKRWYAFWSKQLSSIYQIPEFLNARLKSKHLIVLLDEAHEASNDVLEWLRVLNDQVENLSIVLSGLPIFEEQLRNNLETFVKRINAKISLLSLTKEDTKELIARRIKNAGGRGDEFSDDLIGKIYDYTGGFPREVLRVCDEIINNAILGSSTKFSFTTSKRDEQLQESRPATSVAVEKMTPMQREVLELLSKRPLTPGQIADSIDLTKYKSRQHAVRSVNNIVKALQEEGYLERRKEDKAFVYSLSPRLSTLFVKR